MHLLLPKLPSQLALDTEEKPQETKLQLTPVFRRLTSEHTSPMIMGHGHPDVQLAPRRISFKVAHDHGQELCGLSAPALTLDNSEAKFSLAAVNGRPDGVELCASVPTPRKFVSSANAPSHAAKITKENPIASICVAIAVSVDTHCSP
jgi:hypothetical protein